MQSGFYINLVYMHAFMLILANIYLLHNFLGALRKYVGQPQPNTQPNDCATGESKYRSLISCCSITACSRWSYCYCKSQLHTYWYLLPIMCYISEQYTQCVYNYVRACLSLPAGTQITPPVLCSPTTVAPDEETATSTIHHVQPDCNKWVL